MNAPYIITEDEAGDLFPGCYTVEDRTGTTAHLSGGRVVHLNVLICEWCDSPVDATGACRNCDMPLMQELAA